MTDHAFSTDGASATDSAPSNLRILRGRPTGEEIAALVAVLAVLGAGGPRTESVQPRPRHRPDRRRHGHRSAVSWRGHRP